MVTMLDPKMYPRIAPPPLSPPVINLVTSARNPTPVDPDTGKEARWEFGFGFQPLPNQDPQIFDLRPTNVNDTDQAPHPTVDTAPWWAEVEDQCSTFGFAAHNFVARALAGLAAATPKAVEKEFWDGTAAQANGWPNLYLAMAAVSARTDGFGPIVVNPVAGTAVSLIEGFELLEKAIGDCGAGARGMIHAAPNATPNFLGVRREGNLLLTMRDTIVCSGSGYSGFGPHGDTHATPTATTTWLYATSIPIVLLGDPYIESPGGEVQVLMHAKDSDLPGTVPYGEPGTDPLAKLFVPTIGAPYDSDLSSADKALLDEANLDARFREYFLDRDTNNVKARARRVVAGTWDGVCHFACLVSINT